MRLTIRRDKRTIAEGIRALQREAEANRLTIAGLAMENQHLRGRVNEMEATLGRRSGHPVKG